MSRGSQIYHFCETCDEETPHKILSGKFDGNLESGFDGTVQCQQCSTVHHIQIPVEKPVEVSLVISFRDESLSGEMELSPREEVRVGDEFYHGDHNLLVTSVETAGRRVQRALGKDIETIWTKVFDTVDLKVSVVKGSNTQSEKIEAAPDEEFAVGDVLDFGRFRVLISKIRDNERTIYREDYPVQARFIKRIYTKPIKERFY